MSPAEPAVDLVRRPIGATGVSVTCLGLGGGALGGLYDPVAEEMAVATVRRAYGAGIRYFDTAPLYGHGRSEERVGLALDGFPRDSYTLSCKVGVIIEPEPGRSPELEKHYADPFLLDGHYDFSYDGAMRSLEGSLERLRTDRLDIVYIHDPDEADSSLPESERAGADHFEAVMDGIYRALHELREQGVVGAIGVGLNGTEMLNRFACAGDFDAFLLAGRYTLLEQHGLDDLFPICREKEIALVVGGVFNSGILATGSAAGATYNYKQADDETVDRVARLEAVCATHDVALPAAALQFPLGDDVIASVIPGMRSIEEVDLNLSQISQTIPDAFWRDIRRDELIHPRAALPSWPLAT